MGVLDCFSLRFHRSRSGGRRPIDNIEDESPGQAGVAENASRLMDDLLKLEVQPVTWKQHIQTTLRCIQNGLAADQCHLAVFPDQVQAPLLINRTDGSPTEVKSNMAGPERGLLLGSLHNANDCTNVPFLLTHDGELLPIPRQDAIPTKTAKARRTTSPHVSMKSSTACSTAPADAAAVALRCGDLLVLPCRTRGRLAGALLLGWAAGPSGGQPAGASEGSVHGGPHGTVCTVNAVVQKLSHADVQALERMARFVMYGMFGQPEHGAYLTQVADALSLLPQAASVQQLLASALSAVRHLLRARTSLEIYPIMAAVHGTSQPAALFALRNTPFLGGCCGGAAVGGDGSADCGSGLALLSSSAPARLDMLLRAGPQNQQQQQHNPPKVVYGKLSSPDCSWHRNAPGHHHSHHQAQLSLSVLPHIRAARAPPCETLLAEALRQQQPQCGLSCEAIARQSSRSSSLVSGCAQKPVTAGLCSRRSSTSGAPEAQLLQVTGGHNPCGELSSNDHNYLITRTVSDVASLVLDTAAPCADVLLSGRLAGLPRVGSLVLSAELPRTQPQLQLPQARKSAAFSRQPSALRLSQLGEMQVLSNEDVDGEIIIGDGPGRCEGGHTGGGAVAAAAAAAASLRRLSAVSAAAAAVPGAPPPTQLAVYALSMEVLPAGMLQVVAAELEALMQLVLPLCHRALQGRMADEWSQLCPPPPAPQAPQGTASASAPSLDGPSNRSSSCHVNASGAPMCPSGSADATSGAGGQDAPCGQTRARGDCAFPSHDQRDEQRIGGSNRNRPQRTRSVREPRSTHGPEASRLLASTGSISPGAVAATGMPWAVQQPQQQALQQQQQQPHVTPLRRLLSRFATGATATMSTTAAAATPSEASPQCQSTTFGTKPTSCNSPDALDPQSPFRAPASNPSPAYAGTSARLHSGSGGNIGDVGSGSIEEDDVEEDDLELSSLDSSSDRLSGGPFFASPLCTGVARVHEEGQLGEEGGAAGKGAKGAAGRAATPQSPLLIHGFSAGNTSVRSAETGGATAAVAVAPIAVAVQPAPGKCGAISDQRARELSCAEGLPAPPPFMQLRAQSQPVPRCTPTVVFEAVTPQSPLALLVDTLAASLHAAAAAAGTGAWGFGGSSCCGGVPLQLAPLPPTYRHPGSPPPAPFPAPPHAPAHRSSDLRALQLHEALGRGGQGVVLRGCWGGLQAAVKCIVQPPTAAAATPWAADGAAVAAGPVAGAGTGGGAAVGGVALLGRERDETGGRGGCGSGGAADGEAVPKAGKRRLLRCAWELAVTHALSHPNIVQAYAVFTDVAIVRAAEGRGAPHGAHPPPASTASPSPAQHLRLVHADDPVMRGASQSVPLYSALCLEYCDAGTLLSAAKEGAFRLRPPATAAGAGATSTRHADGSGWPTPIPAAVTAAATATATAAATSTAPSSSAPSGSTSAPAPGSSPLVRLYLSLLEVALALRHLHARRLVHGDLKPANVLLQSSSRDPRGWTCKLSDFGCARLLSEAEAAAGGSRQPYPSGTLPYMAPELLSQEGLQGPHSDVYAFGIMMWELLYGTQPYARQDPAVLPSLVVRQQLRPGFDAGAPAEYVALASQCWSRLPGARPATAELVERLQVLLTRAQAEVKAQAAALKRRQQQQQQRPIQP